MSFTPPLDAAELEDVLGPDFYDFVPIVSGGQAAVFKAFREDGYAVAVKVYYPDHLQERSSREIEALGQINCPPVIRLVDHGVVNLRDSPCVFVATQFFEGQDLATKIMQGRVEPYIIAKIGLDMSTAIGALWEKRIVHRDIKPSNILVASPGAYVLIDLGVARHLDETSLTKDGYTWGTAGYMSPEQANTRKDLTCKSDVFSLGIVLQETLLGRHPTRGNQDLLATGGPNTQALIGETRLPAGLAKLLDRMVLAQPFLRPHPEQVSRECTRLIREME